MVHLWPELGKLQCEMQGGLIEMGWHATSTGVIVKSHIAASGTGNELSEGAEICKTGLAMGAEPQILSGSKRGPLGTGSEPLKDKLQRVGDEMGVTQAVEAVRSDSRMEVDLPQTTEQTRERVNEVLGEVKDKAQGLLEEGKKQVQGFRRSVERKAQLEKGRSGWESAAFNV